MQTRQLCVMLFVSITGMDARAIMVTEGVTWPAFKRKCFQLAQTFLLVGADMAWRDALRPHEGEVKDQMKFIVPIAHIVDVVIFTDQHSVAIIFIQDGA